MNKFVLLCLLSACSLSLQAQELLSNLSFEDADKNPAKAESWGVWGDGVERVTDWEPTADGYAMIGYKHWELPHGTTETSGIFQDVADAQIGETYQFSVYVSADQPDWGSPADKIELRLETNLEGKQVHIASREFAIDDLIGDGWKRISIQSMAPNGMLRALIIFHPSSEDNKGGAIKIDKTKLTKK